MIKPQAISLTSSPTTLTFLQCTQATLWVLEQVKHAPTSGSLHLLFSAWNLSLPSHVADSLPSFSSRLHVTSQKSSLTTFLKQWDTVLYSIPVSCSIPPPF